MSDDSSLPYLLYNIEKFKFKFTFRVPFVKPEPALLLLFTLWYLDDTYNVLADIQLILMIMYKPKSSYWSTKSIHDILFLINEHFRSILLQDRVKVQTNIILKRLFYLIYFYIRCYCSYYNYINIFVKPQKLYWSYIYIEVKIKCLYFAKLNRFMMLSHKTMSS